MDLIKKNIHMNRQKSRAVNQITLDDDYNVPDTKPDIGKVIQEKGDIKIEDISTADDHVMVKGALVFQVLYMSDDDNRRIHNLEGEIPFDEVINIDHADEGNNIQLKWELDDMSAHLINSRKLSVKTIVTLMMTIDELYDEETAVELYDDSNAEYRNKDVNLLQMVVNKKDTFRVKDEIVLASNKPNIYEILWNSLELRGLDMRLIDNAVSIKGELLVFVLYCGEDEESKMEWVETTLPFDGTIECEGVTADMYSNIDLAVKSKDIEAKPDYDGEERLINVEVILELNIKVYDEEKVELLDDVYSPSKCLIPEKTQAAYEKLLIKNYSKCRASDRIRIGGGESRMLQLCHSTGAVKIDEVTIVEDGIEVEGAVDVQMLYITSEDAMPFNSVRGMIPFHHVIDVPGITEECTHNLMTDIEQLSATMIDSEEIEVKVTINLNVMVVCKTEEQIITEVREEELDMNKLQDLPGIVGYIVNAGDTLWDIAKQYYTTVQDIMETNDLVNEEIKTGDQLLIIKTVESLI